ncbi:MAG: hypothetical protein AMS24_04155 [Chlamydiae bacterium SM23_39]|nr:MAG: hypothetical protein AMS24_04155 [Chlamydiae bacterium SM23_39]
MLYQNFFSLKKYLQSYFPNLAYLYLIVMEEDFERIKMMEDIIKYFPEANNFSLLKFSFPTPIKEIFYSFNTPSLLGKTNICIFDKIDLYKKNALKEILFYLKDIKDELFLLLGAKEKKTLLTILTEVTKRGVVVDLSEETKKDKENRLYFFIREKAAQNKKMILKDAIDEIFKKTNLVLSSVEKEMEKVISYVGEKNVIDKEDILNVCSNMRVNFFWKIAEEIIWKEDPFNVELEKEYVDSTFFYSLLGHLRYQLKKGLEINERNKNRYFWDIDKRAVFLKKSFFKKSLIELFKIDLISRKNVNSYIALLDLFRAKIKYFMDYETG